MNTVDALSELGEWKEVVAYPNYKISSKGAVLNKCTLKFLKHFRYAATEEASVTLYRKGKRNILSVDWILKVDFGENATLPEVLYNKHKITEVAPHFLLDD